MNYPIVITEITESDVAEEHSFLNKIFYEIYLNDEFSITANHLRQIITPEIDPTTLKKRCEYIRKRPEHKCSFVAKHQGTIVGICAGERKGKTAWLRSLYVAKEYQRRGIGSLLWQKFIHWSEAEIVYVSVATYNTSAIAFYNKIGFIETGKRFTEERYTFSDGIRIPQLEMIWRR